MSSRTPPPGDADTKAVVFGRVRRHRNDPFNFFTIAEIAERLQVATRTVRRWIKSGDLAAHRFGSVVRIAESDLRAFLTLNREG
jgi:excisionase family DNA binding protein